MVNVQLCALMLSLVKNSTAFIECFDISTSLFKSAASLGYNFLDLYFFLLYPVMI